MWIDVAALALSVLAFGLAGWTLWYTHREVDVAKAQYQLAQDQYTLAVRNPHQPPLSFETVGRNLCLVNNRPWNIYNVGIHGVVGRSGQSESRMIADLLRPHSKIRIPISASGSGDPYSDLVKVTWSLEDDSHGEWSSPIPELNS